MLKLYNVLIIWDTEHFHSDSTVTYLSEVMHLSHTLILFSEILSMGYILDQAIADQSQQILTVPQYLRTV